MNEPDALRRRRPARIRGVFQRSMHDQWRALLAWNVGIAATVAFQLAMFPSLEGNDEMNALVESYPEALRELFQLSDLATGVGYLRAEMFSLTMPLLLIIAAVLWGSDAVAGEENRGTLELLLANPVSRRRVVIEKWAAVLVSVGSVGLALLVVLTIGGPVVGLDVAWTSVMAAGVATTALAAMFGSLSLAVGATTGRRGLARGASLVGAVAAYLVGSLAPLVSWLEPFEPLSPWYHALGVDPVGEGLSLPHLAVPVGLALVFAAVAVVGFERRDLAR